MKIRSGLLGAIVCSLGLLGACAPEPPPVPTKDCTLRAPGVDLRGCDLSEQVFAGTLIESGGLPSYSVMDLSNADLRDTKLTSSGFHSGVKLDGANFAKSDLSGFSLAEDAGAFGTISFKNNDLTEANLTGATIDAAGIHAGTFNSAVMKNMSLFQGFLDGSFVGADLSGSTFVEMSSLSGDLRDSNLSGISWIGLSSVGGDLRGADLSGATISWSVFGGNAAGANLSSTNFDRSDISSTDFTGANLTGASFTAVDFNTVDLTNADLTGATFIDDPLDGPNTFTNVTWSNTTCPNGVVQSTPCL